MREKTKTVQACGTGTHIGVCYLSLVTDLYSHKIVGWAVGPTLDTTYPLQALKMALSSLPEGDAPNLIHHSDRGCQYCSSLYMDTLKSRKIQISMTQSGLQKRCWKNPWEGGTDNKKRCTFAPP